MMLNESPCLPSVYEFLGLSDKTSFARVNKYWRFVSRSAPSTVIDTVGFNLSVSRLLSIILKNSHYLEILRVSVNESEVDHFVSVLLENISKFTNLKKLAIFVSAPDGSVRIPIRDLSRIDTYDHQTVTDDGDGDVGGISSLILQIDPSLKNCKSMQRLLQQLGANLKTIALLRGTGITSSSDLVEFVQKTVPRAECIYLGPCEIDIDMDEVVPHIFSNLRKIQYLQWSNASASLDTLRFVRSKVLGDCDFDGLGFLMFLL